MSRPRPKLIPSDPIEALRLWAEREGLEFVYVHPHMRYTRWIGASWQAFVRQRGSGLNGFAAVMVSTRPDQRWPIEGMTVESEKKYMTPARLFELTADDFWMP